MSQNKEELRKKFDDWFVINTHLNYLNMSEINSIFDFFHREIEAGEQDHELTKIELSNKNILLEACESSLAKRDEKISHLESVASTAPIIK